MWINAKNKWLYIKKSKTRIHQQIKKITVECHFILAAAYAIWMMKAKKNKNKKIIQCFTANKAGIKKRLTLKKNINLKKKLFKKYQDFTWLFEFKINKLFSFKKPKINYSIKLKKINDKTSQISWKSMFNMFQNELLILQNILNDYSNKKFIKINNSSIVLFVLFVPKCYRHGYRHLSIPL